MELQSKSPRRKKGDTRSTNIGKAIAQITLKASRDFDEQLLAKMFRVFHLVGAGGLNLAMDWALEEIDKATSPQPSEAQGEEASHE